MIANAQAEEFRQRYLADHVETATPSQRLMMLFDRLLLDLDRAGEAFAGRDFEQINTHLQHAQQILFALSDTLETSTDIGRSLFGLYSYFVDALVKANLTKDPAALPAVREMIGRIAEANRAAAAAFSDEASGPFEVVA